MNKSKKVFVTVFIVVILLIIVLGYLYFSGTYPGIRGYRIQVYFKEVSGLKTGSSVQVRGIEKGKVNAIELSSQEDMVCVKLTLDKDITLTEDTKFTIRSLSYFGTDRILTVTPGKGRAVLTSTKFYGTNEVIELERFFIGFDKIIAQLESVPITTELKTVKSELYAKLDTLTKAFTIPITSMSDEIHEMVVKLDSLGELLKKDGTVKKIMTSDELYQEVRDTNRQLKELLVDIKANPKKYFTIKIF